MDRIERRLDNVFFRVERESGMEDICFSDLTHEERMNVMEDKDKEWLMRLCDILAESIRNIGDQLDIVSWED